MGNLKDLTGQRFGRLTVLSYDGSDGKNSYWIAQCDCGSPSFKVQQSALITSATTSCGCRMREINKKQANDCKLNERGLKKLKEESFVDGTSMKSLTRKLNKSSKTGVKGVSFKKGKYEASIKFKGKPIYLGRFTTLEEAKQARMFAEEKYYQPILDEFDKRLKEHGKALKKDQNKKA